MAMNVKRHKFSVIFLSQVALIIFRSFNFAEVTNERFAQNAMTTERRKVWPSNEINFTVERRLCKLLLNLNSIESSRDSNRYLYSLFSLIVHQWARGLKVDY